MKPLLGFCHPTVTRNMDLPDKPQIAQAVFPKSFIYAQEGFGENRAIFYTIRHVGSSLLP